MAKITIQDIPGLEQLDFDVFMERYDESFCNYIMMMQKVKACILKGEKPSKNHLYKMRQESLNLEKFGKIFRMKTIAFEKD